MLAAQRIRLVLRFALIVSAASAVPLALATSTREGRTLAQIDRLEKAVLLFAADTHRFPTTQEGLVLLEHTTPGLDGWRGPYARSLEDSWGRVFVYHYPPSYGSERFDLYSLGKNGRDDHGASDDISNWNVYDRREYRYGWESSDVAFIVLLIDGPIIAVFAALLGLAKRFANARERRTAAV